MCGGWVFTLGVQSTFLLWVSGWAAGPAELNDYMNVWWLGQEQVAKSNSEEMVRTCSFVPLGIKKHL